jgi:hypothetical protein
MAEWQLALTVIGSVIATLGLARLVSNDLLSHIKNEFEEAEKRHIEASEIWKERLEVRDEKIIQLGKTVEAILTAHNQCIFRTTSVESLIATSTANANEKFETKDSARQERERIYKAIESVSTQIASIDRKLGGMHL